ncbi:MAG: type I-A CRISPR-associated protein Cas5a [Candidatus Nezhaarchaeales archaeon]
MVEVMVAKEARGQALKSPSTLTALIARLRAPVFSIKQPEAFQVGAALPLPQPSTLAGALAYCIAVKEGVKEEDLIKRVQGILRAARACFVSEVAVPSSIILRRLRVLDKGMERKEKGKPTDYEVLEDACKKLNYDEIHSTMARLSDAMYREYVFASEFMCVWITDEKLPVDLLWAINHIGDTESICSVLQVHQVPVTYERGVDVKTRFQAPMINGAVVRSGNYLLVKMQDEAFWCRTGERLLTYAIPCEERIEKGPKGLKYRIYRPSEITLSYSSPVDIYSFELEGRKESLVGG